MEKIKEFLRPTWKKILAFFFIPFIFAAIIFLQPLLAFIDTIPIISVVLVIPVAFIYIATIPFFILSVIFFNLFNIQPFPDVSVGGTAEQASELLIFLSIIFWWYILACLAAFIYKKSRQDFRIKHKN